MKNFNINIVWIHWKIQFSGRGWGGGGLKNPIYRGELPKKGELGRFAALKGGVWEGVGGGGLDTPMHTMMKQILVLTSFHKVL